MYQQINSTLVLKLTVDTIIIRSEPWIVIQNRLDYLVINNSLTDVTTVELPKEAIRYTLAGRDSMRNCVMTLNGRDLVLRKNDKLPNLSGESMLAGAVELTPGSCTFFVL